MKKIFIYFLLIIAFSYCNKTDYVQGYNVPISEGGIWLVHFYIKPTSQAAKTLQNNPGAILKVFKDFALVKEISTKDISATVPVDVSLAQGRYTFTIQSTDDQRLYKEARVMVIPNLNTPGGHDVVLR
jgi:hypothetical protein